MLQQLKSEEKEAKAYINILIDQRTNVGQEKEGGGGKRKSGLTLTKMIVKRRLLIQVCLTHCFCCRVIELFRGN